MPPLPHRYSFWHWKHEIPASTEGSRKSLAALQPAADYSKGERRSATLRCSKVLHQHYLGQLINDSPDQEQIARARARLADSNQFATTNQSRPWFRSPNGEVLTVAEMYKILSSLPAQHLRFEPQGAQFDTADPTLAGNGVWNNDAAAADSTRRRPQAPPRIAHISAGDA